MREPSPVVPDEGSAITPGSRPWRMSEKLEIGAFSGACTDATVLPSLRASTWLPPVPVVTTAVSSRAEACSSNDAVAVPPAATSTVRCTGA